MRKKWFWGAFAVMMALALFLRVDFLRSVQHVIPHDTYYYDLMVRQLLETGIYGYKSTESNAVVTPGYPLVMAAVYRMVDYRHHDPFPYLRYLNVLLSLATLVLLFLLARKWIGDKAALMTALLAAIYPSFVWTNGAVLTEVPATFLLTAYLFVQMHAFDTRKWLHHACAGVLLGLTAMVRPEFMPLCIPLYLLHGIRTRDRRFWKSMLIAVAGLSIVMSPWWVRNVVVLDRLILTGTQVNPFYAGTFPYKQWDDGLVDPHGKTQKQIAMERLKVGFKQQTGRFLQWFTIGKMAYTYGKPFEGAGHTPPYRVIPQQNLFHQAIIVSGLLGMILSAVRWRREPLIILTAVVVIMSGVRLLFVPEYRYNFTVMPLIILFASYAVISLFRRIGQLQIPYMRINKHERDFM